MQLSLSTQPGGQRPTRESPFQIRSIVGSARELTTEILQLMMGHSYDRAFVRSLGWSKEEFIAKQLENLPAPGSAWFVADNGHRLSGMLVLEPELWPSAILDTRIWSIKKFILSPDASGKVGLSLLQHARLKLASMAELVVGSISVDDSIALDAMAHLGFAPMGEEVIAVAEPFEMPRLRGAANQVIPMQPEHIKKAASMACDNCFPYLTRLGFDSEKVSTLIQKLLANAIKESHAGASVALSKKGQVRGWGMYGLDANWAAGMNSRVADLSSVCVQAGPRSDEWVEMLHRHALKVLKRRGMSKVVARLPVCKPGLRREMSRLRSLGYEVTSRNRVMTQRWDDS